MIKIKNIYWMLIYAYSGISQNGIEKVKEEDFDNIYTLLSKMLYLEVSSQLKRGINREYIRICEPLSNLKGKININDSIKSNLYNTSHKVICEYDEFSINSYMNKIIKTAIITLLKCKYLDSKYKNKMKRLLMYFNEVKQLNIKEVNWKFLRFNRNNISYRIIMIICRLILDNLILNQNNGEIEFKKYIDESDYSTIYERFVREYYKRHYNLNSSASYINWNIDNNILNKGKGENFLPVMKTDITLTDKKTDRILIIDTKFYDKIIKKDERYNSESFYSANIYQLYAYVKNKDKYSTGKVSGILLYAKTEDEPDIIGDYNMNGNKICIRTLDLNQEFEDIEKVLDEIVQEFFDMDLSDKKNKINI